MENILQTLELQSRVDEIKNKKTELDARRKVLTAEQRRIELEWKILEDDCNEVREKIRALLDSADGSEAAPEYILSESILDGGKRFEECAPIEEIAAPIQTSRQDAYGMRAAGKIVRRADLPQKKQIKTLLHAILEVMEENGKMRVRDVAKEVDSDEKTVNQWIKVMDKRGMIRVSSSLRGEVFIEKLLPLPIPQI